jgi:hypothetical protein
LPFTVPQGSIEALERLRDSYKGLSARETLTEAVQIALKQVKKGYGQSTNRGWSKRRRRVDICIAPK